nr:hypothetical protein BaRGS_009881 [Batillaria attramentaria]
MQQQQQHNDDEENNINSSNTNTSCGDRLVSPYKRMKVSDKSRASEKSVSFAPDTSKPSHYATPKLVANCGSSANSLNSGHHANGSRANVANCGSSTDLARSGSHGSAGSLGNAVEPLRPEDSYPSDLALTVKNPTKRKVLQTQDGVILDSTEVAQNDL